jgi:hypothetical protein
MDECNTWRIPHMAISSSLVGLANMPGGYFWQRTSENAQKAKFAFRIVHITPSERREGGF